MLEVGTGGMDEYRRSSRRCRRGIDTTLPGAGHLDYRESIRGHRGDSSNSIPKHLLPTIVKHIL